MVAASSGKDLGRPSALQPVFIAGAARSGTTLLGSMLGSHPKVISPPEPQFLPELMPESAGGNVDPVATVDAIEQHSFFQFWNWRLEGRRPEGPGPWTYRQVIDWLMRAYAADQGKPEITHFVDHTGGHVRYAQRLADEFKGLRFLHIVRDGRAVAASLLKTDFGGENVLVCAEYWVKSLAFAYSAERCLPQIPFLRLRYEDLVGAPEATMRQVVGHLDLDFAPAIVGSNKSSASAFTAKYHGLIGSPPDASRINAWRRSLSQRQVELFESVVFDLLTLHGYQPDFARPRPVSTAERVKARLALRFRKASNAIQHRWRKHIFAG